MKKKVLLCAVLYALIFFILIVALKKIDDSFMKSCTSAGYSKEYCESQK